ncbi:MAG: hypothetical protein DWQ31_00560 [Planctomycetota bacterium]|nr:MAG: hypothetical protein DWQ31_00560 [Planctomycetota bacterium]REJ86682.1 MAG: hypothetical protein DWQ35_22900 [Planctomycetota bacterium]REK27146.1 MAG: hypothetical protein DWQ42_07520 [Planctomycetota bacterium]REK37858.1 MAG: hypothetical protein DWQ46_21590 [Planctomycetota bacterium]
MRELITLPSAVALAGWAQLILCIGVLALPKILGWRKDTAQLRPITREIFWVYAAYTWTMICSFGLVSALAGNWILDAHPLAAALTCYMALFWSVRIVLQFAALDRRDFPVGRIYKLAEVTLVGLFVLLASTYTWAAVDNLTRVVP